MKSWISIVAATAACGLLAGEAAASIPPPSWNAPTWTGPAKVCGEAFAFDLQPGETARQGYPSVGIIRYAVQTPRGGVEIAELWAAGPPETAPEAEDRPGGTLRPLADPEGAFAGYLFMPKDKKGLPVTVTFRASGQPATWTGRDLDPVLKRIDFGRIAREGCTEPKQ